jgi:hypothetical protein
VPLYLPLGHDDAPLGVAIHAEGIEQADVLAHEQYGDALQHVIKAPRSIRLDDRRTMPHRSRFKAKPPSMYAESKLLTGYGVFEQPEWKAAIDTLNRTEWDEIQAVHAAFVRRANKLAQIGKTVF